MPSTALRLFFTSSLSGWEGLPSCCSEGVSLLSVLTRSEFKAPGVDAVVVLVGAGGSPARALPFWERAIDALPVPSSYFDFSSFSFLPYSLFPIEVISIRKCFLEVKYMRNWPEGRFLWAKDVPGGPCSWCWLKILLNHLLSILKSMRLLTSTIFPASHFHAWNATIWNITE